MRVVDAVGTDRLRHLDAVFDAEQEIVLAMAGRDMDEAAAILVADEIAGEERHGEIVTLPGKRMARNRAGERRALERERIRRDGEARGLLETRQQLGGN